MIKYLELYDEHVLNLENLCQGFSFSQTYFETMLFNQLLLFDNSKTLWVIFEPEKCKDVKIPIELETVMGQSVRIHSEDELEARIRFILQVALKVLDPGCYELYFRIFLGSAWINATQKTFQVTLKYSANIKMTVKRQFC